jgi:hypothetical protein
MHKHIKFAAALALLATSSCATLPGPTPLQKRLVTVSGNVKLVGAKYMLQATLTPFELSRLDHIDVKIESKLDANDDFGSAIDGGRLDPINGQFPPIVLANLRPLTFYRVRLNAYQADTSQDGSPVVLVNDTDVPENSETLFSTFVNGYDAADGSQDSLELEEGFKLGLRTQTFSGGGTGNIAPSGGGIEDGGGDELIQFSTDF